MTKNNDDSPKKYNLRKRRKVNYKVNEESSDDDSDWDVSIAYAAGATSIGFSTDESDAWEATVGYDLGSGASFNAGVNEGETSYATVGFSF